MMRTWLSETILKIGLNNFQFEISETVNYYDRSELYEIDNNYSIKYDLVTDGFNSRRNVKTEQVDI